MHLLQMQAIEVVRMGSRRFRLLARFEMSGEGPKEQDGSGLGDVVAVEGVAVNPPDVDAAEPAARSISRAFCSPQSVPSPAPFCASETVMQWRTENM